MIDLHAHSTFSDGSLTPAELAAAGTRAGLSALALTDHDTVDGLPAFLRACAASERPLQGVPGIEISVDVDVGTFHLLGYYIDPANPPLCETLQRTRASRDDRNAEILERLAGLGMKLTAEEVARFAGDQVGGRPHIAQAMVEKGYAPSFRKAFDLYLGKGQPAYVDRFRLDPNASLELLRGAGGLPVLAHPFTLQISPAKLFRCVQGLAAEGLAGIEVFYPEHNSRQTARYLKLAQDLDLVATGGTDFHGAINPDIALGRGFGSLCVPDAVLDELQQRRSV